MDQETQQSSYQQQHPSTISSGNQQMRDDQRFTRTRLDELKEAALSYLDGPKAWFNDFAFKASNIAQTNFDLAREMITAGEHRTAIFRLKVVLKLDPDFPKAHYLLGSCYIAIGKEDKASYMLQKAVTVNPDDELSWFVLATLDPTLVPPERMPTSIPHSMALEYFTINAARYEYSQDEAGYRGHQLADEALWDALDRRRMNYRVLELGCGTGLCGVLLAEHAEELVGVDFCPEMIELAKQKRRPDRRRIYTKLASQDIRNYIVDMHEQPEEYNAVVAAHVFNYIGFIDNVFDAAAIVLKPEGVFVFQVELYPDGYQYGLLQGLGRFGHSDQYIREHLARVGLECEVAEEVHVYPDYTLMQYVARKPERTT